MTRALSVALLGLSLAACTTPLHQALDRTMKLCEQGDADACGREAFLAEAASADDARRAAEAQQAAAAISASLLSAAAILNAQNRPPAVVYVCGPYVYGGC